MLRRFQVLAVLALPAVLIVAGCATKRPVASDPVPYAERGIASWYGTPFHGRRPASGERYDMHQLTAAHRTLPFGAVVRVTNLRNGRSVKVRITDRGPWVDGRIIDLSRAAAKKIKMIESGTAPVKIRVIRG